MDEKTKEDVVKLIEMFGTWRRATEEVKHYIEQGADCFTVSVGPWTITYDNTKESEVRDEQR